MEIPCRKESRNSVQRYLLVHVTRVPSKLHMSIGKVDTKNKRHAVIVNSNKKTTAVR